MVKIYSKNDKVGSTDYVHNFIEFDSIYEMVNYIDNNKENSRRDIFKKLSSLEKGREKFKGTASFSEAQNLLLNGWDVGSKKLAQKLKIANLNAKPKEVIRALNDVVGFQVNVPRYLQGIPQHMINQKRVVQKQKVITLIKSVNYSAAWSTDYIMEDSIEFLKLVQEIEKQGIRTNIYTLWNAQEIGNLEKEVFHCKVKIKSADERLNISKMSYPLVHPSFIRRHMFRLLELEKRITSNEWYPGYGYPLEENKIRNIFADKTKEIFIPVHIKGNEEEMEKVLYELSGKR